MKVNLLEFATISQAAVCYNSDADELVDKCVAEEVDALPIYYGAFYIFLTFS